MIRVSGCSRVPFPPARMTPFTTGDPSYRIRTGQPKERSAGRPRAHERALRRVERDRESSDAVRLPVRPGPVPPAAVRDLHPVGARALARTDLPPQRRARAAPPDLRERKAKSDVRGLGDAAHREEAALEAVELRLVADRNWISSDTPESWYARSADSPTYVACRLGATPKHVGRIRLVAVLGQPDRLAAEVVLHLPRQPARGSPSR